VANPKKALAWKLGLLLPLPLLWCVALHYGRLQFLENKVTDLRYRFRGEIQGPAKIVYVNLDTRALQLIGEHPWNRGRFAEAAEAVLQLGGAKAVAFDIVFSALARSELVDAERDRKGNIALAKLVRAHPEVILAAQYTTGDAVTQVGKMRQFPLIRLGFTDRAKNDTPEVPQFPVVGPTWGRVGLIDIDYGFGGDDMPRWAPLFAENINSTLYHISVELALLQLGLDESAVHNRGDSLELLNPDGTIALRIPLAERQLVEVNWFTRWASNAQVSLGDVISAKAQLESENEAERVAARRFFENFKGALVLIGPTDSLLHDLAPTPFDADAVPRVAAHGNLLQTILSGRHVRHLPEPAAAAITLVLTLLMAWLSIVGGARGVFAKILWVLLAALYVMAAFQMFRLFQLVVPVVGPLGAAFTTSFGALLWQVLEEQKQKGRIKGMFGTYLSPTVVESLIDSGRDPELGGHDAEITPYFSDIQEFSSFSEVLPAAKLGELLNEYLTACTDIVQGEGGTLDKFIGDAVVAMYGAPVELPDHAYRACVATQLVQRRIAELREKWRSEGERWPRRVHELRTRIGLNTGVCMIGNMGSKSRFNYTMMGDNVNLAARMESGAKSWGAYTMVTESTRQACARDGGDRLVFRPLGRIVVKGRSQPVPIHEIVGLKDDVGDRTHECLGLFAQALERYYARDFAGAAALFRRSALLEPRIPGRDPGIHANPSLVYIGISEHYAAEPPPEGWDGVYVMKEK